MGSVNCTVCPAGSYPNDLHTICTKCDIGYYSSNPGSTECIKCPAGTISSEIGSTYYTVCPAGYTRI